MYSSTINTSNPKQFKRYLILIILCIPCIPAAFAQQDILEKRITIQLNQVKLSEAITAVEKAAGCSIAYSETFVDSDKVVSLNVTDRSLSEVMQRLFGDLARGMQVRGTQINIQPSRGRGAVSGTVRTSDGQPAGFVTVGIRGQRSTQADIQGRFTLENIEAGTHTITASYVGLQIQEQSVIIRANETTTISLVFDSAAQTLQTVEVTGRKSSSYKSDYSFSATKVQMALIDIPQTVSTVTKELIQDKQAVRLNDVVQHVAGVSQFSVYDDITVRGFRSTVGGNRLINGLRVANNWTSPNLVNIEKIEVIKGPASAAFANSNPGGTVNLITKKPLDESRQFISFGVGS